MSRFVFAFILSFIGISTFGQSLSGLVQDTQKNPVEGVYILNLSNREHAHSDKDGEFILNNTNKGDSLFISHIGYRNQTIVISQLSLQLKITLVEKTMALSEVVISSKIDALNLITDIDSEVKPVSSSQDFLRQVPGIVIGQHAGGGKAEQIFLRGFDIDHGTDINITVDGMPVNMVSHAHGQGYADMHFVIPETMDKVKWGKGTYYADKGNFTTAGYVDFRTKDKLENSEVKLEIGDYSTHRILGLLNVLSEQNKHAYIAAEQLYTDGAFDSPQNFNRINLMGKYVSRLSPRDKISLSASTFRSRWDASGQIPQRAVNDGIISRFGAIDDTEGGNTGRVNAVLTYDKIVDDKSSIKTSVYYSKYDFELYSNFTFFLDDPVNGDQIKQKEERDIYGINSKYTHSFSNPMFSGEWHGGLDLRHDESIGNELSHTSDRKSTLEQIQLGDINETNFGSYLDLSINRGKLTLSPGIRFDYFKFIYNDGLQQIYQTQSKQKTTISPKFNAQYNFADNLQLYLKSGKGFHSNDTRVIMEQTSKHILPSAYGFDMGFIWKPFSKTLINTAYWYLFMEQEFVYVGDAGVVEPGGETKRQGIDVSIRHQFTDWLYWNFDMNYAYARSIEEAKGADYIPLAPDLVMRSALNIVHPSGLYGSLDVRHINNRPANEDNSIVAKGYTVVDMNAGYKFGKLDLGFQVLNLFDTEWNETQFATESRLQNEAEPVEEIHFIPGTPFFFKGIISYRF